MFYNSISFHLTKFVGEVINQLEFWKFDVGMLESRLTLRGGRRWGPTGGNGSPAAYGEGVGGYLSEVEVWWRPEGLGVVAAALLVGMAALDVASLGIGPRFCIRIIGSHVGIDAHCPFTWSTQGTATQSIHRGSSQYRQRQRRHSSHQERHSQSRTLIGWRFCRAHVKRRHEWTRATLLSTVNTTFQLLTPFQQFSLNSNSRNYRIFSLS